MKAKLSSKTISFNNTHWIYYFDGTWQTLMYGSFMNSRGPGLEYRWVWVEASKVPKEVKELA